MNTSLGSITKEADGYKVRFERIYPHDINAVWDAITNPEKLKYWFTDIEMDFRAGGKMQITFRDKDKTVSFGEIVAIEKPHRFVWKWEYELAEWELSDAGNGNCKVIFTYSKLHDEHAASAPAGLHWMLDELGAVLNGSTTIHPFGMEIYTPELQQLKDIYVSAACKMFPELERYEPIVVQQTYQASLERVWQALTDNEQMKQWYFDIPGFKPEEGFEFQFYGQGAKGEQYLHLCKITEVIPLKKLSHTWAYQGYPGHSTVTFELQSEGDHTRLTLTHKGLGSFPKENPDFARNSFNQGWTELIRSLLKKFVEADGKPSTSSGQGR